MADGDDTPPGVQMDRAGTYDALFFRLGGAVCLVGVALVSFVFYDGPRSDRSLAGMAGVTHLRLEGALVGAGLVLLGLLVAVGGPILYRELR